jgi:hypothetical protein
MLTPSKQSPKQNERKINTHITCFTNNAIVFFFFLDIETTKYGLAYNEWVFI